MVLFFFYKNLTSIDLIKQICLDFEISNGWISVKKYSFATNTLEISKNPENNTNVLEGIIVDFDLTITQILEKISQISECKFKNKYTYTFDTIQVNKKSGDIINAYIIY
jgi:hypothetical protein